MWQRVSNCVRPAAFFSKVPTTSSSEALYQNQNTKKRVLKIYTPLRMRISSLSLATIHYYFNSLIKENATPKKQMKVNHLWLLYEQMEKARVVGKDHFLTVWGGGGGCWWDLRGECPKRWLGGADKKIFGIKGEVTKRILSSFAVTASVIRQTTYQNAKNQHF